MNIERDKALTVAMGGCWHEFFPQDDRCKHCDHYTTQRYQINPDFSEWQWFGKLVGWAKKQDWWESFCAKHDPLKTFGCWEALVDPDRFANAVFEYLNKSIKSLDTSVPLGLFC